MMATQIANIDQPRTQSAEAEKFALMQRQASLFASSPLIPEALRKGGAQQAMANCYIAMTIADRMGEDRMTVMQNIIIVHGTAGFKSQYMIARANSSGVFKDGIDWDVRGKGAEMSVTAFATLASTERRVEITVDMAMAKAEGWTKNSKYQTMPEIMLRYRSAAFLVRMYAPQVMLGHQTAEEMEDVRYASGPIVENKPLTAAALLNPPTEQANPETGEIIEQGRDDREMGEAHTTKDALADILDHLARKVTVIDVNSLVAARVGELDDDDREALAEAQIARIAEIKAA